MSSSSGQATIYWKEPNDASITKWPYRYKTSGNYGAWADVPNAYARTYRHTVTGLNTYGTLYFTVRAVNARATPPGVKSDVQEFTFYIIFLHPMASHGV